jgi:hypothetical protein
MCGMAIPTATSSSSPTSSAHAARPCPTKIELARSPLPPRDPAPDLKVLIEEARRGRARRVTLKFDNPIASCACPDFTLDAESPPDSDEDAGPNYLLKGTHLIFPAPVPEAYKYVAIRYDGETDYEVTGYFTGREIDTWEFWKEQWHQELVRKPDEEERDEWPRQHLEFCVESWCFKPDANPSSTYPEIPGTPEAAAALRSHRANYAKTLRQMRADGVRFCPAEKHDSVQVPPSERKHSSE